MSKSILSSSQLNPIIVKRLKADPYFKSLVEELLRREKEEQYRTINLLKKQKKFVNSQRLINILDGGNRSGKTTAGAFLSLMHCSKEYPTWYKGRKFVGPINWWVIAISEEISIEIQQKKIHELIKREWIRYGIWDPVTGWRNKKIIFKDGSEIKFKFVAQGSDKFQGKGVHGVWFDEDPKDEGVWEESLMRLVDYKGMAYMTFTPIANRPNFTYRLWKRYLRGDEKVNFIKISTYDNAKNLGGKVGIKRISAMLDPETKEKRLMGDFYFANAKCVFNMQRLQGLLDRKETAMLKIQDGEKRFAGYIEGHQYLIGLDASENVNDRNAVIVYDRMTKREARTYRGYMEAFDLAEMSKKWGYEYGTAVIIPEAASNGMAVIEKLKELKYPKIFQRETFSKRIKEYTKKLGWKTGRNKSLLESCLQQVLQDEDFDFNDARIIAELLGYTRNEQGKTGAIPPDTDDMAIAYMLTNWYDLNHGMKIKKNEKKKNRVEKRIEKLTQSTAQRHGKFA